MRERRKKGLGDGSDWRDGWWRGKKWRAETVRERERQTGTAVVLQHHWLTDSRTLTDYWLTPSRCLSLCWLIDSLTGRLVCWLAEWMQQRSLPTALPFSSSASSRLRLSPSLFSVSAMQHEVRENTQDLTFLIAVSDAVFKPWSRKQHLLLTVSALQSRDVKNKRKKESWRAHSASFFFTVSS